MCNAPRAHVVCTLSLHDALPIYERERHLWDALARDHDLDWITVRQFFINFFGDAIAYQREPGQHPDMYHHVHQRMHDHLVDRKSTRLNSSHRTISYAVFCLKKKK